MSVVIRSAFALAFALLSGCITSVWSPEYTEIPVDGFYVNQESCQILVSTKSRALVFDNECALGSALLASRRHTFIPTYHHMRITRDNRITGEISLTYVGSTATPDQLEALEAAGFTKRDNQRFLSLTEEIDGRLYNVEGELPLQKLEKTHIITVALPRKPGKAIESIIATPAAITIDAAVTVPAVFLLITGMAATNTSLPL